MCLTDKGVATIYGNFDREGDKTSGIGYTVYHPILFSDKSADGFCPSNSGFLDVTKNNDGSFTMGVGI